MLDRTGGQRERRMSKVAGAMLGTGRFCFGRAHPAHQRSLPAGGARRSAYRSKVRCAEAKVGSSDAAMGCAAYKHFGAAQKVRRCKRAGRFGEGEPVR